MATVSAKHLTAKKRRQMKKAKPRKLPTPNELPFLPGIANAFGQDIQEKIAASIPDRIIYFGKIANMKGLSSPTPEEFRQAKEAQKEFEDELRWEDRREIGDKYDLLYPPDDEL